MLQIALDAADEAGRIIMGFFEKEKSISHKGKIDLVTAADVKAEKAIVEMIRNRYPDHGFVLEEQDSINIKNEYVWVVDPIDGTTSFAHDYPMFATSIALFKDRKPVLGVVKVPYLNELFVGVVGRGSTLNNRPIKVSKTDRLEKSLLATGFPYTRIDSDEDNLKEFSRAMKIIQGIRRSGSSAVDICYVACGRLDGYWESGLKQVDTAGANIILEEAGGRVSDYKGLPLRSYDKVVASNKVLHDQILKMIGE